MDRPTVDVYEQGAEAWTAQRVPRHLAAMAWLDVERIGRLPVADLGCGPGWHLEPLREPAIGLDAAAAMLRVARGRVDGPLVQASVGALPFGAATLGAAVASRVHTHLRAVDNPLALADLHRCLVTDAPVLFEVVTDPADPDSNDPDASGWGGDVRSDDPFPGRLYSRWTDTGLADLIEGAGFVVESSAESGTGLREVRARRRLTLPDTVGPRMSVLMCGLNPSIHAAEAGVGFVTGSNRFWPGAMAAGLVSSDRDPYRAFVDDAVGMTDLVKRATRRADELTEAEYRTGLARVERLVAWLQPRIVCFVGLTGWRVAVDRSAVAGLQPRDLAGRPVYVMPSTSGLNAHCQLPDVIEHFTEVRRLSARM